MTALLDPTLCPDCRSTLDAQATCTGCGLRLTGPLAGQLWQTMQRAATLVEALRRQPSLPAAPPVPVRAPRRRTAVSVPFVLFGVGALCLLVAAVVFVAVAWSSLGLGAKTAILLGVTTGLGLVAVTLTQRALRGGAETFWLVTAVLVVIDLAAAYGAGLLGFDDVAPRHAVATVGIALLALGTAASLLARTTPLRALHGMTGVATTGALVLAAAEAWTLEGYHVRPLATVASVLVAAGSVPLARALRLAGPAYGLGGVAVLGWLALAAEGAGRAADVALGPWWTEVGCWPLLVAALLAAAVAVVNRVAEEVRMIAAGAVLAVLGATVLLPAMSADTRLVLGTGALLALAGVAAAARGTWSRPAFLLGGVALVPLGAITLLRPVEALTGLPTTAPAHAANLALRLPAADGALAGWTAVVVPAGLAVAVLAGLRLLAAEHRGLALRDWSVVAPVLAGLGLVTAVLESSPTLVVAVGAWSALLALLGLLAVVVRGAGVAPALLTAAYLSLVGLRLAMPSHVLLAGFASALAVGLAVGYRRTVSGVEVRTVMAVAATLTVGLAAAHWPFPLGGGRDAAAVGLVLVAVALGLLAPLVTRGPVDRVAVELTALVLALAGCALPADLGLVSLLLTATGTAAALTSVLHRDRDEVAWVGVVVLAGATLLRITEHLTLPELATAPAAVLLLAAGYRRLLVDPAAGSRRALGSGLTLALLPTLVLVVDDPVSVRSVALGVVASLFVALGIAERWSAPFLAGAAALAVLAVVHLEPVASGLPRWLSLGLLGAALLGVAVTWEQRRQNLATAERYLDALR
ncbi:MAG: hypothetical protein J7518_17200 [Nocardioidaceae bacterium]|nr:hypothetical protein [Nocardioidaceae bacterium]